MLGDSDECSETRQLADEAIKNEVSSESARRTRRTRITNKTNGIDTTLSKLRASYVAACKNKCGMRSEVLRQPKRRKRTQRARETGLLRETTEKLMEKLSDRKTSAHFNTGGSRFDWSISSLHHEQQAPQNRLRRRRIWRRGCGACRRRRRQPDSECFRRPASVCVFCLWRGVIGRRHRRRIVFLLLLLLLLLLFVSAPVWEP